MFFFRILPRALCVLALAPFYVVPGLLFALNAEGVQRRIGPLVETLTGGQVVLEGLSGSLPAAPRLARVTIRDAEGDWLVVEKVALDWNPGALLDREGHVLGLSAALVHLRRLPAAEPAPAEPPAVESAEFTLPVRLRIDRLAVERIALDAPVAGQDLAFALTGSARVADLRDADAEIALTGLGHPGRYTLTAGLRPDRMSARLGVAEPAGGLIGGMAGLAEPLPLDIDAALDGPSSAAALRLTASLGPLAAEASGTLDLDAHAAQLEARIRSPHMTPLPGIAWASLNLEARLAGSFAAPDLDATLEVDGLDAAGVAAESVRARANGDRGRVNLDLTVTRPVLPGVPETLLSDAPLHLIAEARLDQPGRPVRFDLTHPVAALRGTAVTDGTPALDATADLPDLARFSALAGVDLAGRAGLTLRAAGPTDALRVELATTLSLTGGPAPAPALVGPDARLTAVAVVRGSRAEIEAFRFAGAGVSLEAQGEAGAEAMDLTWSLRLNDLAQLAPTVAGPLSANGRVRGPMERLSAEARLETPLSVAGGPAETLRATLTAENLPTNPTGRLAAEGRLLGQALALELGASRQADGTLVLGIPRGSWASLSAQGDLRLPPGATLPIGRVALNAGNLADLSPLAGQRLAGRIAATLDLPEDRTTAVLDLEAHDAALPGGVAIARATLAARVTAPLKPEAAEARLAIDGLRVGGQAGRVRLEVSGPADALGLTLDARLAELAVMAAGSLSLPDSALTLRTTEARARGETLRLLAPVRIAFAEGVTLDRLRLGLRGGSIEAAGRVSPALDLTLAVRDLPLALATLASPDLAMDGTLRADARLTGAPARPTGTVRFEANGVRMRTGPARALPAASLSASADLAGAAARLTARLTAGQTRLEASGRVPLDPAGALDLRANGTIDLALLDPILTPDGRRLRGRATLEATATGRSSAPVLGGGVRLTGVEFSDAALGLRLTGMEGRIALAGDSLRLERISGRAGPGTLAVAGSVGVLAPGMPISLDITARNARPVVSDQVTADLDADLTLRGNASDRLAAGGTARIRRAEIRLPERMPVSITQLRVRERGARPEPPAQAGLAIPLDIAVEAPSAVFIRGRGLEAEMFGSLRVRGTAASPEIQGALQMRRGQFEFASQSLRFTRGRVDFDGATGIDPALDFVARTSAGGTTAILTVAGVASRPEIRLSSEPELPQDEVLARLIFGRSSSSLSPFQMAAIASAAASLAGGGDGADPLDRVRRGLGLDRLTAGEDRGGRGATVEGGRYVADGVYLGARQGTAGGPPQATVQIELTPRLRIEADVGSTGGSRAGIAYELEY